MLTGVVVMLTGVCLASGFAGLHAVQVVECLPCLGKHPLTPCWCSLYAKVELPERCVLWSAVRWLEGVPSRVAEGHTARIYMLCYLYLTGGTACMDPALGHVVNLVVIFAS